LTRDEDFVAKHAPELDIAHEQYGSLLHVACVKSSPWMVGKLLAKARDFGRDMSEYVNTYCTFYYTPLYCAAYRGNLELINMLLDEGAEIDRSEAGMLGSPLDAA
jgi:ankyrin repeat protein